MIAVSRSTVTGRFTGRGEYAAPGPADAEHENVASTRVLSRLGSQHGSKRMRIDSEDVTQR